MSLGKKLLSGVFAIGFFTSVFSTRALNSLYFYELNKWQRIVMPQNSNEINLRELPRLYEYLQELFFLIVDDGKSGDDIEGLCVLQSSIHLMIAQMYEKDMNKMYESGYIIFAELIYSISHFINIIFNENSCNRMASSKYLIEILNTYQKIDKNGVLLRGLENLNLYKIYYDMKSYMYSRCMYYHKSSSGATPYGALFAGIHFFPSPITNYGDIYRQIANNIASRYADVARAHATARIAERNFIAREALAATLNSMVHTDDDSVLSSVDKSYIPDEPLKNVVVETVEYTQPNVTVEDDKDGSYARMLVGKAPDENLPLFPDLEKSEDYDGSLDTLQD